MYSKGILLATAGSFLIISGLWFVIISDFHFKSSLSPLVPDNGANHWYGSNINLSPWPHWLTHINYTHNFLFGQRRLGDRLIFMDHSWQIGKFLHVLSTDVFYPLASQTSNKEIITCIKITDQRTDGNGGSASIISGGVGFPFVHIHINSQRSYGFDFVIEIFGQ